MKTNLVNSSFENIISDINKIATDTILIITDLDVWSLYHKELDLEQGLKDKRVIVWKAPKGEKVKDFSEYQSCLEFFLAKGIHRNSHVIAFGGGATSDFAGFVASTLLRGIAWSIIPTTLLSMIDASIGGKVAINTGEGKNLVGSFHLPTNVWINSKFLKTLPDEEVKSGYGELMKYAFLNKDVHNEISKDDFKISKAIELCSQYKLVLTEEDFKETGNRKILNLGHSFGHVLERYYHLCHGEAVMWGMVLLFKILGRNDLLEEIQALKIKLSWTEVEPPWKHRHFPFEDIMENLRRDKKSSNKDSIDLILVESPGAPKIVNYKFEEIDSLLKKAKDDLKTFSL
jgi:3-dehydroquinate synthetase